MQISELCPRPTNSENPSVGSWDLYFNKLNDFYRNNLNPRIYMGQILLHFTAQETEGPPGEVHDQSHKP